MYKKIFFSILILSGIFFLSQSIFASPRFMQLSKNRFISYTDEGKGAPLILIHAFPTDQQLWQPQQEGLKDYFRVITLDLWGFGQSSPVDGKAVTMKDYADEVSLLLDALHIRKAIIGGESMGGYIALAFVEAYPDKVAGLILSDTQSIADSEETKAKREASAQDILKNGPANFISGFMTKALSPEAKESDKKFLRHILEEQSATAMASALRGMALRHDMSDLLANMTLPVLIMTGDQDALISPDQSEAMHKLAKNSRLVKIAHAGHLSNIEQYHQWCDAVLDVFYNYHN